MFELERPGSSSQRRLSHGAETEKSPTRPYATENMNRNPKTRHRVFSVEDPCDGSTIEAPNIPNIPENSPKMTAANPLGSGICISQFQLAYKLTSPTVEPRTHQTDNSTNMVFIIAPNTSFQRTLFRALAKNRLTIVVYKCIFIVDTELL